VLGALRAGVPMAVAPLFADQFYNADRVAEGGAGIRLPTSSIRRLFPTILTRRSATLCSA
jgi:UDP:flavonoid glycosyltransferase YjiC (YdhE family)